MKKLVLLLTLAFTITASAQSFNEDKTSFSNFIKRMYSATPFEGVKIVDDYEHQYLISVISLEKAKYNDPSIMNRIAQVKAQSQANTFLNGASISMDIVIKTSEKTTSNSNTTLVETIESIKQNSTGFTQGLELLTNFDNADSKRLVFIYMREIIKEKK
jgi:hypothetical protein